MAFGVLEPKSGEKVPGTVHVDRHGEHLQELTANLKHGSGKDEGIVLVPQPSDSVNDPLNWSERSKLFHSWYLAIGTGLASSTCFFLNPSATLMAKEIGTTVTELSRSVSFLNLCVGIACVLTTPLARMYGKRPIFLALCIIAIIGYSIILANPKNITYFYAGRALWGAGVSALEYLVTSSVGDLFFVHQRGFHLALWHFALSGGNSLGQVIASQIVAAQDYVWPIRYAVIFMSAYVVGLFFVIPETTYIRSKKLDNDVHEVLADEVESISQQSLEEPSTPNHKQQEKNTPSPQIIESELTPEKRKTYVQTLKLYNGRFSKENYFRSILSPFATFMLPGVSWAAYSYGSVVALSGALSITLSQYFSGPPYNFSTRAIGFVVFSPFVGNIIGNLVPGPLTDYLVTHMSRANGGIYEPEFRNILCIPAFIASVAGYWGFGLAISHELHWFVPVFFFGLSAFGGSILSLISNTYLLDCHRKYAQDSYAAVQLFKSVISFAIAFVMNAWLANQGPVRVYFVIGAIQGVGAVWGLVLYVWGKRIRLAVSKNQFIKDALLYSGNKD